MRGLLMYPMRLRFAWLLMVLQISDVWAGGQIPTVTEMRASLAELGGCVIEEAEGRGPKAEGPPYVRTPREENLYQLARAPREPVREAIDQALKGGTKEELIGALTLYRWIVSSSGSYFPKEPLNPSYLPMLYDLLAKDDGSLAAYTGTLAGSLSLYPTSRETILVYMDLAEHTTDAKTREDYLLLASGEIGIDLPIYKQTPALEREKILADFEAWFAKNKNQIAFDEGRSVLAGSRISTRPRVLTQAERQRIRKDPACVLELLQVSTAGMQVTDARAQTLLNQCGDALFGAEGAKLLRSMKPEIEKSETATFDQQMGLAASRAQYPMIDAGLLAVAYVAADDPDPKHRELARKTLDDIGSPEDITRVLKGETKEVRKKAMALADETNEAGG
jgi:hypothetical protein